MTDPDMRACVVASHAIRKVMPGVDAAEFARRAANYRAQMPEVTLTPSALCKNWAMCDHGPQRAPSAQAQIFDGDKGRYVPAS